MKKFILTLILFLPSVAVSQNEINNQTIFAAGCFWCIEYDFEKVKGVTSVVSGYTDGDTENPSYQDVGSGRSGHTEAIKVTYDPKLVSYNELLNIFWSNVDPFDNGGQFCDRGSQYRSGIYYLNNEQKLLAEKSKEKLNKSIVTPIKKASKFYPAEDYHQDFYKKNPLRYKSYRYGCGRDKRLKEVAKIIRASS